MLPVGAREVCSQTPFSRPCQPEANASPARIRRCRRGCDAPRLRRLDRHVHRQLPEADIPDACDRREAV